MGNYSMLLNQMAKVISGWYYNRVFNLIETHYLVHVKLYCHSRECNISCRSANVRICR